MQNWCANNFDLDTQLIGLGLKKLDSDSKPHTSEVRLITNLKPVNQHLHTPKFKQDTWTTVMQTLKFNPLHRYAVTLDLRHWFFHLGLHPQAQRWVRIRTPQGGVQMNALPFGLQSSPYWSTRLSRPVQKFLREKGIAFVWYVDDILLLGPTPEAVLNHLELLVALLTRLGVQVNLKKSVVVPSQDVLYLGHHLHLDTQQVTTPHAKLVSATHDCLRLARSSTVIPQVLARVAGRLLDIQKSHPWILGLPKQFMRMAGILSRHGWYLPQPNPPALR